MKSKKRLKITKIIFTIFLLSTGTFLYLNRGPRIQINYTSEFLLGKPVKIEIDTYNNFKLHTPETFKISISNRYNKNESLDSTINAYEEGKYELLITPNFAGEYQVHITYIDKGVTKNFTDAFLVE